MRFFFSGYTFTGKLLLENFIKATVEYEGIRRACYEQDFRGSGGKIYTITKLVYTKGKKLKIDHADRYLEKRLE